MAEASVGKSGKIRGDAGVQLPSLGVLGTGLGAAWFFCSPRRHHHHHHPSRSKLVRGADTGIMLEGIDGIDLRT